VTAIALSVFHKTEVSLVLVQYAYNNKSHMYTTISNIRALKYLELLLRLGCAGALNVENEFHFATRCKFCRWWQEKLS